MSAPQPEPADAAAEPGTPSSGTASLRARRERASRKPPPPRHPKPPLGAEPIRPAPEPGPAAPPARAPQPRPAEPDPTPAEPTASPATASRVDERPPVSPNTVVTPAQSTTGSEDETADEISREITQPPSGLDVPRDATAASATRRAAAAPAAVTVPPAASPEPAAAARPAPAPGPGPGSDEVVTQGRHLPDLEIDLDDPTALLVTPTVLSVPNAILRRFEQARVTAPSHTALVLDALRAHAAQLPDLVAALRPGPRPGDLFPYRATPGAGSSDRPGPLRIRPTAGELGIMDRLTAWVNDEIRRGRAGIRKVSRSEVVAVALDSYLPPLKKGR
jgi:hypothetical protein